MIERRSSERIAIVGGGMLGMTLAYRLSQAGKNVTLFESAPSFGGLAGSWQLGDVTWDKHYHVTLLSDLHLRKLLEELGLEAGMKWGRTYTGFFTDGRLHSMSNALEFLGFEPLGLFDKARLAATILHASRIKDWKSLENMPVADWLRQLSGERTFRKIWLPLLRAKLGDNYLDTSAAFIWTTINRMYAARRSGLKHEMFGYLPGGYGRLLDVFAGELFARKVRLMPGTPVRQILSQANGQVMLACGGDNKPVFDRVIVTAATPVASHLAPGLTQTEHNQLNKIRYQGIVCASVLTDKPLSPYYVTNITDAGVPFTGIIEMSALVDREQFGGKHLIYLPKYVSSDDRMLEMPDGEIQSRFLPALERMYRHFHRSDVSAFRVSRVRYVVPLPTLNYSQLVPATTTSIPGLSLVNSAQIVNGTLNVNETVQLANSAAHSILTQPYERPVARRVA